MKQIIVLIDFTDCCKIALQQARVIATKTNAKIYPTHIALDAERVEEATVQLKSFVQEQMDSSFIADYLVGYGEYMEAAPIIVNKAEPDLVVLGTHGIRGIKQQLFGAYILKLVQSIKFPCIVVQENTEVNEQGFSKILFPIGPHPNYHIKIAQTAVIAGAFNAEIVEYEIVKMDLDISGQLEKNRMATKAYFTANEIKHTRVKEEATVVSIGYSRQTIKYLSENSMDLISIMSEIPSQDVALNKADKENLLTNPEGIPVLCCNG